MGACIDCGIRKVERNVSPEVDITRAVASPGILPNIAMDQEPNSWLEKAELAPALRGASAACRAADDAGANGHAAQVVRDGSVGRVLAPCRLARRGLHEPTIVLLGWHFAGSS